MQSTMFFEQFRQRIRVRPRKPMPRAGWSLLGVAVILLVWQVVTLLQLYPTFIIPPPAQVAERFYEAAIDGQLWLHTSTTLFQMLGGLVIGVSLAMVTGYLIAQNSTLEALLSPVIVAVQSTPVVAYAPLLVIWFGSGATSKVITSALIVFFPMLMNTIIGIREVPAAQRELMNALSATRLQTLIKLEIPAALPVLLGGLKVSATLSVIGAVVGEFVSAEAGLGRLINIARFDYDTPLVFVAVIMLALIARTMYGLITLLERRLLRWQQARAEAM
ncbi:MAG: ABC transporter permease [bacterium]|nr:ABC transporter permease [bacterium]